MSSNFDLFVTCPKNIEYLLVEELVALGGRDIRQTVAGAWVVGDLAFAYRCCLWSRLANKVLLSLGQCAAEDAEALYEGIGQIQWSDHLRPESNLWIDCSGTNEGLKNSQFAAQKAKDAIVDQLRSASGLRPSVSRHEPDLTINIHLRRSQATVNIDLCGPSLHRRGYRVKTVSAPLKQNLAAALLIRAGWPNILAEEGHLIDPMCGSGTLLIEAAMMAADIAPGSKREQFAFERWLQHDPQIWMGLKDEASRRQLEGLERQFPEIRGYDHDKSAINASEANAEAAGVDSLVRVMHKPLSNLLRPSHKNFEKGLVITNPPYGDRLSDEETLLPLYAQLGDTLKQEFSGWDAAIFTGNKILGRQLGLHSHKSYKLYNGSIESELLLSTIYDKAGRHQTDEVVRPKPPILSEGAEMVANRLRKKLRQLKPWAKQARIDCYRLYDADLPEYAAAVDIYADKAHVQEYLPPSSIDEKKAERRLEELMQALGSELGLSRDQISLKQRRRNRGKEQYQRLSSDVPETFDIVSEGKAKFAVNLWAYLDTGIFLDHRLVRAKLASIAQGKHFLNLFCYTATATVQAALAGAKSSISVDMSNTYLAWARKNFDLNKVGAQHQLVRANCLDWLNQCRQGFDLILLDPPSFSNSKRMEGVIDIQRDHPTLIKRGMELLNPGGTLIFSTNLRRFRFDHETAKQYRVEDISDETIDKDFQRNQKIHQCFLIRHE